MSSNWKETRQRARSPQEKRFRRDSLIDAATALLEDVDPNSLTMARIAERAGISKGTAYLYFSSKEAIELFVLLRLLAEWGDEIRRCLKASKVSEPAQRYSAIFASTLSQHALLRSLLSQLHVQLEPNASYEEIERFKIELAEWLKALARLMSEDLKIEESQALRIVLQAHALAIGVGQMSNPSIEAQKVMSDIADLAFMDVDFEPFYEAALSDLFDGQLSKIS
nr:TetR family transcriptional regulator [Hyphomonas sp. Mor2]